MLPESKYGPQYIGGVKDGHQNRPRGQVRPEPVEILTGISKEISKETLHCQWLVPAPRAVSGFLEVGLA